mgnify:CR=1 FL=1
MTPFEVLGLTPTDDKMKIRRAFVRLAKTHHPDHGGDSDTFNRIQSAYDALINNKYTVQTQQTRVRLGMHELLTGCVATAIVKLDSKHAKMIEFRVPPLTNPGTTIKFFDSEASHSKIAVTVDLDVPDHYMLVKPHVLVQRSINRIEANRGIDLDIEHFDGQMRKVKIPPGTAADKLIYAFPGEGFFNSKTKERGDFKVVVTVQNKR